MAIVISGVNNNDKITASDGTIDLLSGVNFTTEITAHSFKVGDDIQFGNAGIATAANFKTGVSNLHSLGLTLSGGQLDVGSHIKLGHAGIVTATTFVGNVTGNINNSTLLLQTGGTERARIDSSGRLLVGTTSTSSPVRAVFQGYHGGGDNFQARVQFQTNQATNLSANQHLANLLFTNSSGSVGAEIRAIADNAWGTNDYPGRLEFYTTPDGSNTSTERLRIDSSGRVLIGQTSSINGIFGSPPPRFSVSTTTASPAIFATYSSDSYASRIDLLKSRNATVGSHTVVQDGDGLGEIYFGGSDGDQFHGGALIQAVVESGVGNDDMPANLRFYTNGGATTVTERLRITSAGHLKMPDGAEIQLGNDSQLATGDLRLFHNGSNSGIINSQGALYVQNTATNSSDLHLQGKNSIQFHVPSDGTVPLHILNTGEVRIKPRTGGNTTTQFSFNNTSSTPFVSIKSNNVNDAAELRVEESSGGASWVFKNKNLNSLLHTHFKIGHSGGIYTAKDGNVKSYPIVMSMYTQHDEHEGQLNYHSLMGPSAGIGGWVYLGHDYGPNPYPVRTFKIAVPEGGNSAIGTRVYQVWHNGDANYDYGGLWEVRINQWNVGSRFESVSIRCLNGKRDDMKVIAYNNTNGIMLRPSTIWGGVYIRLAGWDENQVKRGSSYCAVQNNGALAIYNAQGTDDGTPPTSGSPFELLPYPEGTGGRDIENNNSFNG